MILSPGFHPFGFTIKDQCELLLVLPGKYICPFAKMWLNIRSEVKHLHIESGVEVFMYAPKWGWFPWWSTINVEEIWNKAK